MKQEQQGKNKSDSKFKFSDSHNFQFYHEYVRLYIANVVLCNQMKELVQQKSELSNKMIKLEKKSEELGDQYGENEDRKKRFRRTATEIERHYKCPIETCQKSYGSEGSLNQHLKLKHPEYAQEHQIKDATDDEYQEEDDDDNEYEQNTSNFQKNNNLIKSEDKQNIDSQKGDFFSRDIASFLQKNTNNNLPNNCIDSNYSTEDHESNIKLQQMHKNEQITDILKFEDNDII